MDVFGVCHTTVVHRVGLSQIEHQVSIKCRLKYGLRLSMVLIELVNGLIEVVYGLDRVGL